jgi:hypothetical protein
MVLASGDHDTPAHGVVTVCSKAMAREPSLRSLARVRRVVRKPTKLCTVAAQDR